MSPAPFIPSVFSISPARLKLCFQICPRMPDGLPAALARVCRNAAGAASDTSPTSIDAAQEARILTAYAKAHAAGQPNNSPGLPRILGHRAFETLDYSGVKLAAGAALPAYQLRGILAELPARCESIFPATKLRVEFGTDADVVVVYSKTRAKLKKSVSEIIERDYLAGVLDALLARCGWAELARIEIESAKDASKSRRKKGGPAKASQKKSKTTALTVRLRLDQAAAVTIEPGKASDRSADAVVRRSAELFKERKELKTAVEFLHLANEELERQIRMNKRELDMARNIQKGFVPRRIPDWKGLQFWVKFFPMAEVSGDFYDYFTLGSSKLGFMVCDVSGHGVPAALISAIAKLSFNSHNLDSPAEVFSKVNLDLLNYVKKEGYLTSFYMIINSQNEIVYSVGAAPAPLLLRARTGTVEKLAGRGTLLGMFPDAGKLYEDRTTHLEPGDKLFVFTDGLTEAKTRHDEFLDEAELIRVIQETRGMDVQRSCEHVMDFYDRFTLGRDPADDLTLVTIVLSEREGEFNDLIRDARKKHNAGEVDAACEILRHAITIFPRHTPSLFLLGKYLFQARRFGEATEYLNQYNALKPYNADSYTILAECALLTGNVPLAIDHIKRSLSLRTENPGALYLAARVYDSVGRRAEALEAFHELEHLRPRDHRTEEIRDLLDI